MVQSFHHHSLLPGIDRELGSTCPNRPAEGYASQGSTLRWFHNTNRIRMYHMHRDDPSKAGVSDGGTSKDQVRRVLP